MSEEEINQAEEPEKTSQPEADGESEPPKRRFFTRRNALIALAATIGLAVVLLISVTISYRYGIIDDYIKAQFTQKMADIGIVFSADVFRVTVAPLELELKNATFNNRVTGEKLFFIRDARLGLTIDNLYAWQLSRDISLNSTEIDGAEVWINFDENGKSNFAELEFVEDEAGSRVNFKYSSVKFSLKNGLVHFGDRTRRLSGEAKNIVFLLEPENYEVPDEKKRYRVDFTSTASNFVYDESRVEPVDIRAQGIVDNFGAEITNLSLTSPVGTSNLKGTVRDWESPKYDLEISSTVDLTRTSEIFPLGTPLRGFGNFNGKVTGEGEKYRIDGEITSEAISASNIYLKALNVDAALDGKGSAYDLNGRAIAELLTFEDFEIDFPQLIGNIRGTGTDFKWVGELQAAAVRSPLGTIGGLYITRMKGSTRRSAASAPERFSPKTRTSKICAPETSRSRSLATMSTSPRRT
jgi:hypothetical protein